MEGIVWINIGDNIWKATDEVQSRVPRNVPHWPSSVPLKAGNRFFMWRIHSLPLESRRHPYHQTGNSGLRNLYKHRNLATSSLLCYPKPKLLCLNSTQISSSKSYKNLPALITSLSPIFPWAPHTFEIKICLLLLLVSCLNCLTSPRTQKRKTEQLSCPTLLW